MTRNVVVVDKNLLDDILKMKKAGFSKAEIKAKEGNGYKLMKVKDIIFHKVSEENRMQNKTEFAAQLQSMAEIGQIEPVKLYRGSLIDGRHRYWALKDLGVEYIKYIDLPNNTTINELISIVHGTEVRRSDTPAQKAAKAYMDYAINGKADEEGVRYYAIRHATSPGSISKISKIADKLGNDTVKELYQRGEVFVMGKRYVTISPLYQLSLSINVGTTPPLDTVPDMPKDVLEVFKMITAFKKAGEITKVAAVKTYCTKVINELNND